jgi:hypothetical protein
MRIKFSVRVVGMCVFTLYVQSIYGRDPGNPHTAEKAGYTRLRDNKSWSCAQLSGLQNFPSNLFRSVRIWDGERNLTMKS